MGSFATLLDLFSGRRALVVGDLMLDDYVFGTATRISPEAPVMVIRQDRTKSVPGGAANVAKNIAALGGEATVVGVVGEDSAGEVLCESLKGLAGVSPVTRRDGSRSTTRKTRIVADHAHQVLRIDNESTSIVDGEVAQWLLNEVESRIQTADVVVMSDYQKGVLADGTVQRIIEMATHGQVPVVANPKPVSARYYGGASLVSLNRVEAGQLSGMTIDNDESVSKCLHRLRQEIGCNTVVVTLGERGMVAIRDGEMANVASPRVEVYDTAGAGDTVIATLAMCLSVGANLLDSLRLAAETSARVVRHVGVAVPDERDLNEIRSL